MQAPSRFALLALLLLAAAAQAQEQGSTRQNGVAVPIPVPMPVPELKGRAPSSQPSLTTSGNSCTCQVAQTSGGACMIFLRTNAADWIFAHAPQTALRSSAAGRYYDAPFDLAASACAGRKVAAGGVKVHWLDQGNVVLEWK